jgi:translation elongation factor EF-Tu-like GTPase
MPGDNIQMENHIDSADSDGKGLRFAIREGGRTSAREQSPILSNKGLKNAKRKNSH